MFVRSDMTGQSLAEKSGPLLPSYEDEKKVGDWACPSKSIC